MRELHKGRKPPLWPSVCGASPCASKGGSLSSLSVEGVPGYGKPRCLVHLVRKVLWPLVSPVCLAAAWAPLVRGTSVSSYGSASGCADNAAPKQGPAQACHCRSL